MKKHMLAAICSLIGLAIAALTACLMKYFKAKPTSMNVLNKTWETTVYIQKHVERCETCSGYNSVPSGAYDVQTIRTNKKDEYGNDYVLYSYEYKIKRWVPFREVHQSGDGSECVSYGDFVLDADERVYTKKEQYFATGYVDGWDGDNIRTIPISKGIYTVLSENDILMFDRVGRSIKNVVRLDTGELYSKEEWAYATIKRSSEEGVALDA